MDIPLWPNRNSPAMSVSFPPGKAQAPRPALVVFRGGAYATSSGSGGGSAEWLAKQGVVGAVVPYRVESGGGGAFSNELHVEPTHPPVFIWTTRDDALVPYTHSTLFATACEKANVPVQLELYPHGAHGLGLALGRNDEVGHWTSHFLTWLAARWGPF
jgi:acetyl esterase/lipase